MGRPVSRIFTGPILTEAYWCWQRSNIGHCQCYLMPWQRLLSLIRFGRFQLSCGLFADWQRPRSQPRETHPLGAALVVIQVPSRPESPNISGVLNVPLQNPPAIAH